MPTHAPKTPQPPAEGQTLPSSVNAPRQKRPRRWPFVLLGLLLVIVFGTSGGYFGYQSAIQLRQTSEAEQVVTTATEHFFLGLEAQKNKNYALARQHFEYVIILDPNFPGAMDKLTEVMIAQMATTTPTTAPSPTPTMPTPTPDLRTQDEIYNQARQYYLSKDWDGVFAEIDRLRTVDPAFHAVEVDGMLYTALRYRGIRKIYQEANLEGGMYDLALAERIAPLDSEALAARNAARMYLNAISFWGADWAKVVAMLEQVYPVMPNMRDNSGLTAIERYRQAVITQAAVLANKGDMCGAYDYYAKALSAVADSNLELTATAVYGVCHPPTGTPEPSGTPTPTLEVTPSVETPSPTPTTEAPATETPTPTTEIPPTETPTTEAVATETETPTTAAP